MNDLPKISTLADLILVILENGSTINFRQMDSMVASKLNLTSEQLSVLRKGTRTEFAYRMAWARQKLKGEGKLSNLGSGNWVRIS